MRNAPTKIQKGAIPETSRAIKTLVMVVPILAPKITPVACARSMIPALIKPMTMTVVAEEDWITTVTNTPSRKPIIRFRVSFSSKSFIRDPAAISRPSPMYFIPNRNAPSPPSREIILDILTKVPPVYNLCKKDDTHSLQVYQALTRIATIFSFPGRMRALQTFPSGEGAALIHR